MSLRDRFLGVLRHRCTCLRAGERSDLADDLVRAVEVEARDLADRAERAEQARDNALAVVAARGGAWFPTCGTRGGAR